MFHKAVDLNFCEGTTLEVTFRDGLVKAYDVSTMFDLFPQMKVLNDRQFFLSGKLVGPYGIVWNDELDIETESIYQNGITVRQVEPSSSVGDVVIAARAKTGMTQKELAQITGVDQSDISRIERGSANPTVETLEKLASGLGGELVIKIVN